MDTATQTPGFQTRTALAAKGAGSPRVHELERALAAERLRVQHIHRALACIRDARLRTRWQADVAESIERMRRLEALLLKDEDRARTPGPEAAGGFDDCLLEAMELARANGDARAAETVALECLALMELHCQRIRAQAGCGHDFPRWTDRTEHLQHEKRQ